MEVNYRPIGTIHSPFTDLQDMPIQPTSRASAPGVAEVLPELAAGLQDLAGFTHIILLYHLHQVRRIDLTVTPFLGSEPRGVFATRAPTRPNPIGLSIVRLVRIEGNRLYLGNVDILDGTPLLDIKPYVPEFDRPARARAGWLEGTRGRVHSTRSDGRFR
jgi:tRNA-Thr(GGU) m(6)t(6)A37 methyltransferase TsaA